jgi:hypothetical protein
MMRKGQTQGVVNKRNSRGQARFIAELFRVALPTRGSNETSMAIWSPHSSQMLCNTAHYLPGTQQIRACGPYMTPGPWAASRNFYVCDVTVADEVRGSKGE